MTTAHNRLDRGSLTPILIAGFAALLAVSGRAQSAPDVAVVVARLHAYLDAYEPKLGELVADEVFEQRTLTMTAGQLLVTLESRRLESHVGFLRLPGNDAWLGQRQVRKVNGTAVAEAGETLDALLTRAGGDVARAAKAIALGNARFNLAHPRTVNVPTLPLELLRQRHGARFSVSGLRREGLRGRPVIRLDFSEHPPGGLVSLDGRESVRSDVRAWVDEESGTLYRARVEFHGPDGATPSHMIRVDFDRHPALGLAVPTTLREEVDSRTPFEGEAVYSNYRRFQTSGRVVP